MLTPIEIGKKLSVMRGNVPREEVARNVGVSLSAIQMYENGSRVPRDDVKVALADYYGTTVGALFFGE